MSIAAAVTFGRSMIACSALAIAAASGMTCSVSVSISPARARANHANRGALLLQQSEDRPLRQHPLEDLGRRIVPLGRADHQHRAALFKVIERVDVAQCDVDARSPSPRRRPPEPAAARGSPADRPATVPVPTKCTHNLAAIDGAVSRNARRPARKASSTTTPAGNQRTRIDHVEFSVGRIEQEGLAMNRASPARSPRAPCPIGM